MNVVYCVAVFNAAYLPSAYCMRETLRSPIFFQKTAAASLFSKAQEFNLSIARWIVFIFTAILFINQFCHHFNPNPYKHGIAQHFYSTEKALIIPTARKCKLYCRAYLDLCTANAFCNESRDMRYSMDPGRTAEKEAREVRHTPRG